MKCPTAFWIVENMWYFGNGGEQKLIEKFDHSTEMVLVKITSKSVDLLGREWNFKIMQFDPTNSILSILLKFWTTPLDSARLDSSKNVQHFQFVFQGKLGNVDYATGFGIMV